jgi:hypothetical protein
MRLIGGLLLFVVLAVAFNACFDPPQFSIIPVISYNNIIFKAKSASVANSTDSLILTINFKDGDGDLGLDSADVNYPYENKDYFLKNGTPVYFPNNEQASNPDDTLVSFRTKRLWAKDQNLNNDTLPNFVVPFCCTKWDLITTNDIVSDTLYCRLNPNYYNIFINIYEVQSDGSLTLFDFTEEFGCSFCDVIGYNGRFPVLSSDPSKSAPLEGQIRYGMTSALWTALFSIKTLQLKVVIQDRALHKSDTVVTPRFRLSDITH